MFSIDPVNKNPIYKQLVEQVLLMLSSGILKKNDQLPSIRDLAQDLGINPNTVQRAYRELESSGIIVSIPKKGSYISRSDLDNEIKNKAKESLVNWLNKYKRLGLDDKSLIEIMKEVANA